MGLFTSNYRTSVLTDFSIVSKAMFYIMKKGSGFFSDSFTRATNESPLPVQINPDSLSFDFGNDSMPPVYYPGINWPTDVDENVTTVKLPEANSAAGSLSIDLTYDVYDEYFVRTMDGLLTSSLLGTDSSEMSLMSQSATSLKKLTEYAARQNYYVLFVWGNISYFGLLSNVRVAYSAFSRWGDPLKARASIEIKKQPLEYDRNTGLEKPPLESSKIDILSKIYIKGYTKVTDTINKAALVATQALR